MKIASQVLAGLALAFLAWSMSPPNASAQGDLTAFCNRQNALCTGQGCSASPGPQGIEHCRKVTCGGRLAACLKTGCYQWTNRPAVCFGKDQLRPCSVSSCEAAADACRQTEKQQDKKLNCERNLTDCRKTGIWSGTYAKCRIPK